MSPWDESKFKMIKHSFSKKSLLGGLFSFIIYIFILSDFSVRNYITGDFLKIRMRVVGYSLILSLLNLIIDEERTDFPFAESH